MYDGDGNIIANYQNFENTWLYDKKSTTSNLLGHITDVHMAPNNWVVMNVERAMNFFSKRFAAAIWLSGRDTGDKENKIHRKDGKPDTWERTANFAEELDKVIDATNAYRLIFRNPAKRPLSLRNPYIEETLQKFVDSSSTLTKNPKSKSKAPCLKGLPLTVNAIICSYHDIQKDFPGFELAAGLCNQDSLEHLFSKLRQIGGHVSNPTARMVRSALRHTLSRGKIEDGTGANV